MEKVKITQAQADAIESWLVDEENRTEDKLLTLHAQNNYDESSEHHCIWNKKYQAMNGLSVSTLAKALYIGYEVGIEEGEWAYHKPSGRVGFVARIDIDDDNLHIDVNTNGEVIDLEEIKKYSLRGNINTYPRYFRHATPSEIAEEKERRFFARHGREPWELKRDDVLLDKNKRRPVFVVDVIKEESNLSIHVSTGFIYPIEYIKEDHRVISFVGGRLDVKTNE